MNNHSNNDDIDSKIADFMADIDEIVQGKRPQPHPQDASEWKQCFDEKAQSVFYWNTNTNECSWDSPLAQSQNRHGENPKSSSVNKRSQANDDDSSQKKPKKPNLIAEYASSSSSSEEEGEEGEDLDDDENVDHIDELLNEVLEEKENLKKKVPPVDPFPTFEADCRNAIARLVELGDRTTDVFSLRIQLETRLEDCLAGHLPKVYAMNKLNEALIRIEEFEKTSVISAPPPMNPEPVKAPLTANEVALLLSLPPPPPPPSPPPPTTASTALTDSTMQQFYDELNADNVEPSSLSPEAEKPSPTAHHRHQKDKKSKPSKNLPTDLIQKWAHARQELCGFEEMNES